MKNTFKKGDRVIFDKRKMVVDVVVGETAICRIIGNNGKEGKLLHRIGVSKLKLDEQCGKPTPMGIYNCTLPKGHEGRHSWDEPEKATPRPWRISDDGLAIETVETFDDGCGDGDKYPKRIVYLQGAMGGDSPKDDKELIVRAVNEYDALKAIEDAANELVEAYALSKCSTAAIRYAREKRELLDLSLVALAAIREGKAQS